MSIRVLHVVRNPIVVKLFLRPIIREELARGHRVELACGSEDSLLADTGVPVHGYPIRRSLSPLMLIAAVRKLAAIIRAGRYDVVVAHMVLGGLAGRLAFALAGRPGRLLYASHGLPCYRARPRAKYFPALAYEVFMRRWTDAIIVLNRYDYDLAVRYGLGGRGGAVNLLPSVGIDRRAITARAGEIRPSAYRAELGVRDEAPVISYLGRFIAAKGIKLYLETARRYLSARRPANFLIAGYGPLEGYARRFIRRHRLAGRVRVIGWHEDNIGLLVASDILCLPTLYEGSPVVIQEAMTVGTAVLASRIPGPEDLVEEGITGLLARPGDPDDFADKLSLLLNEPELRRRLEAAAREKSREFDVGRCVSPWAELIEKVAE